MSLPFYCIVPEVWGKEKKTVNTGLNSFSGPRTVRIELLAVFFFISVLSHMFTEVFVSVIISYVCIYCICIFVFDIERPAVCR